MDESMNGRGSGLESMNQIINDCAFIILAGGKSSRMKSNKALLHWNGITFLDTLIQKAKRLGFEQIITVGYSREVKHALPVFDQYQGRGPLGGIHAGLLAADVPYGFIIGVDIPQVEDQTILKLMKAHKENKEKATVLAHGEYIEPLIGVYNRELAWDIEELIKEQAYPVFRVLSQAGFYRYRLEEDIRSITNINTMEDLELLRAYYGNKA